MHIKERERERETELKMAWLWHDLDGELSTYIERELDIRYKSMQL